MKERSYTNNNEWISFSRWLKQIGASRTTGYRWRLAGIIHPVNIAGRLYLHQDELDQFTRRAKAGEFAGLNSGCVQTRSPEENQ